MKTLEEVVAGLAEAIPADVIQPEDPSRGIHGDYITAQYAMQKANKIFGVDGVECVEIASDDRMELLKHGLPFGDWVFITTVRVHLRTVEERFNRPGRGVGVAQAPYNSRTQEFEPVKPQQIDTAVKASLSDAIKNALMRTGRALGAELYFDEKTAQALGYEDFSARATSYSEKEEPGDLGDVVCEGGWGKDKKYQGMSLREIYADEDGRGAMRWASGITDARGFTARMKKYYDQREAETATAGEAAAENVRQAETQSRSTVKMWYGEEKPVDGSVNWRALVANKGFQDLLIFKFNPDGAISDFSPNHPRVRNHLKRHFHIDSGELLTWNMLQALYTFCNTGSEAAAFGWPDYYSGDRVPTEATVQKENPPIAIGPDRAQSIPSHLQKLVKEMGVENPDEWLWIAMGEKAIGEWLPVHTGVMEKIIVAVQNGNIKSNDFTTIKLMWEVGIELK